MRTLELGKKPSPKIEIGRGAWPARSDGHWSGESESLRAGAAQIGARTKPRTALSVGVAE